jgi:hypothetical protein
MSKGAKPLRLAEWRPWRSWRPWFGNLAKKVLSKLLLILKAAKAAKKMATRALARETGVTEAGNPQT